MRVVMFGYQTPGHRTLQALLDSEHEVVLVITHPKSDHAYERIWSDSVADLAAGNDVPVLIRDRPDDEEPTSFSPLMKLDAAEDLDRLVRALSDPYPNAFTHYRAERVRVVRASVSDCVYGGTPGRVFIREGDGAVIVAGAEARRGRSHGLWIERVRTDDGTELPATGYFRTMGGYLR